MQAYLENLSIPDYIQNVKLDIGTSYGANQSQVWLEHDPTTFVFGIEANPDCIEILRKGNITVQNPQHPPPISQENLETRFHLIPVALGNTKEDNARVNFYKMARDCGTSSVYYPCDPAIGEIKETIQVPMFSLKAFLDVFPWDRFDHIDYLKIDTQGADLDILMSAGDYLKEKVVYITAEAESAQYHHCGHNTEENMTRYLDSQGFMRINHPNTQDPTYINVKYIHLKHTIFIYQRG